MESFTLRWFRRWLTVIGLLSMLLLTGCSGPDQFGTDATIPPAVPSPTMTVEPTVEPEPSPSATPTETPEPTPEPSPTIEEDPTPSPEPPENANETPSATVEAEGEAEPTAEIQQLDPMEALPRLEDLTPDSGFVVADQGERSAEQLSQAYMDFDAHRTRLEEWGFIRHVYREFTRTTSGPEDTLPSYLLSTVNVYGSPEQADLAMQWIERSQVIQGSVVVDAPAVGEAALAMTQRTSQGEDAAWVVFRHHDRVYIYYAQGSRPLDEVSAVASRVFKRLANPGDIA